jgi:uracil-DNA glycosylase
MAFADASGERLRQWLRVDIDTFYNAKNFAILPMGFCYPGKGKTGDLPPRPECAAKWRQALLAEFNQLQLTLIVGQYAWRYHAEFLQVLHSEANPQNISEAIKLNANYLPEAFVLLHPSPRNNVWLKRNAWFERQLPLLQLRVRQLLCA